jgi:XTP/dITP diphosphohydrolase
VITNHHQNMQYINFATTNQNKIKEASHILGIAINSLEIDLLEPQSLDVTEVSIIKAKDAFSKTQLPVIVEDTGLAINSLNGLPGALIKWFIDTIGNDGIIRILSTYTDRKAYAITSVAFCDGGKVKVYTGQISGCISLEPRGENGFGWDKIFIPDGSSLTFAEMSQEEKNNFSMRTIAFKKMSDDLTTKSQPSQQT